MIKKRSSIAFIISVILVVACIQSCKNEKSAEVPFKVNTKLFNQNKKDDLGLKVPDGIETFTVFSPSDSTDHFSNGVVMTVFKNTFYCQWQSSLKDEDSEDTWVAYSRSEDGTHWSKPKVLSKTLENGYCTSGGWWKHGDTLVAYINEWPNNVTPEGGFAFYKTSIDGINWSEKQPVLMIDGTPLDGVFEQDPHALPDGRIVGAAHFQPGLIVSPIYTDDPLGISGWKRAEFFNNSIKKDISREIEPSWFLQEDNNLVMVFRDQNSTYFNMASVSGDRGETWTKPVNTNMPDSRSKQSAGNFKNGTAFIINNPVNNKTRMPLVLTLSENGKLFNTSYIIRKGGKDIQPLRYEGTYKRLGYHYPKSFIWNNNLYISYATNKEDVEYTKVQLTSLTLN
ncbi:sialidase family protein [Psychroserpens sp. Hel_I_66]|uniref:sialidase family protein n=1 Tax=Psychroserpens sp. Hel_I_66 TaxID=1250004 RepID=UPI0006491451|nr:sialidase family protein [Psychroserpens sp. Hel_I_66]